MNQLRVLLVVGPRLFRDALHTVLARRENLIVTSEELDNIDILVAARQQRADVVVATFEATTDVPPLVTHLLAEFPQILVVGIQGGEQRAWTFRNRDEVETVPKFTVSEIIRAILGSPENQDRSTRTD